MAQLRAELTRMKLLAAATACLVERGLAGATTNNVAKGAGVSQGAVFKHFATKPDLLAAAVEDILGRFVVRFHREVGKATGDPIHAACAVLWRIFREPAMRGVFEVYVAARTDEELAARLAPILARHREAILREARELFPSKAPAADFEAAVDAVVYAMQGAAIGLFAPDDDCDHLAFLERLARRELARLGGR